MAIHLRQFENGDVDDIIDFILSPGILVICQLSIKNGCRPIRPENLGL